ncbi:MAG: hypothetical protein WBF66_09655, partial [Dehalococcoidia bacterium]
MADVELFAVRMGCVLVLDKVYTERLGSPEDHERAKQVSEEMMRRIRESPVVAEEPEGDLEALAQWRPVPVFGQEPSKRTALRFGGRVAFRAHWPRKNQELLHHSGPCVEDFALTYDGAIYTATLRCTGPMDPSYSFVFGREGRRILEAILAPSDRWDLEVVGPSPMAPAFYIAFADDPAKYSFGRELIREGGTRESVLVMPRADVADPTEAVSDILKELCWPAAVHYEAVIARLGFFHEVDTFYSSFRSATKLYEDTLKALPRDPRRWLSRITSNRKLRQCIGTAYTHYAELEEVRAAAKVQTDSAAEVFSRDPLLEPHRMYTADLLADIFEWRVHHMLEAVRFLAEESRSRGL